MTPLPSSIGTYLADVLRHLDHGTVTLTVTDHRVVQVDTRQWVRWRMEGSYGTPPRSTGATT